MTYAAVSQKRPEHQNWRTPTAVFKALDDEYGFSVDLFADDENHLCPLYFTEANSAFEHQWCFDTPAFGNPEYKRGFIEKALDYAIDQVRVKKNLPAVGLLVPMSATKWFSKALRTCEVHLFEQRIRFTPPPQAVRKKSGSNFSNAFVIIRPLEDHFVGVAALRSGVTGEVTFDYRGEK